MPDATEFKINLANRDPLPFTAGLAPELEAPPLPLCATDVRKAEEVERFGLSFAACLPSVGNEPAELDEPRLLGMQGERELRKPVV
jgi:hypothetical protein